MWMASRIRNGCWREMFNGFTHQQQLLARNVNGFAHPEHVSASHTSCNTGALVSGVRLERSLRTGWRGEVHDCVCESRTWASISYPTASWRTVETSSSVAKQYLVESGRRVLMSRIVDVVELSGLERFLILHNHCRNHHRQGWRFPDNTNFSTELSVSGKPMGASRKDEFGKCKFIFGSAKNDLRREGRKNVFFFILREKEIRRLTSN